MTNADPTPTTTPVRSPARRQPLAYDAYTDLTGVDAISIQPLGDRWVQVTFPGDLTPEQVAAVEARLESTDDVDQADRAVMRELVDRIASVPKGAATMTAANRRFLIDAMADFVLRLAASRLGDPLAVRPTTDDTSTDGTP